MTSDIAVRIASAVMRQFELFALYPCSHETMKRMTNWAVFKAAMESTDETEQPMPETFDEVNHPSHYNSHPSGIECITVAEHHNFNIGSVLKYIWRHGLKSGTSSITDLKKARFYISREIDRLEYEALVNKHSRAKVEP